MNYFSYTARTVTTRKDYCPSVSMQTLTPQESSQKFGQDIIAQGYQPITVTMYNESDNVLFLRSSAINLPMEKAETIINAMSHSTMLISCYTVTLSAVFFWPALVPAIGASVWMAWDNNRIKEKIYSDILQDNSTVTILPYEHVTKTFFVALDALEDSCSLHLFNIDTKAFIPYSFQLRAQTT